MTPPCRQRDADPAPRDDSAFDHWLRGELARLYGDALHEPVPEPLLNIVKASARR